MSTLLWRVVITVTIAITAIKVNAQEIPRHTFSTGLGIDLFTTLSEEADLGIKVRPSLEYYFAKNLGLGARLQLDYSKLTTPSKVTISNNRTLAVYLKYYFWQRAFVAAGSEVDLYYQYVPNVLGEIGYSIPATFRFAIEPSFSYLRAFGPNVVNISKMNFGINFRYFFIAK